MNPGTYPRMNPGDHLDAMPRRFWNKLVDIANWFDRTVAIGGADYKVPPAYRRCNAVQVTNATGSNLDKGAIVALGGSVYDPKEESHLDYFRGAPVFVGTAPAFPKDIGRFAVLLKPLGANEVGPAAIDGAAWCKVYMDKKGRPFADIEEAGDPTARLVGKEYGGAEILYVEGQDDEPGDWEYGLKEALVRIGSFNDPDLVVSWTDDLIFGMANTVYIHDESGPTARTIPLWPSLIAGATPLGQNSSPPTMAWAHFHRASGLYELGANVGMMNIPTP